MVGLEPFLFLVLRKKVSESGVWWMLGWVPSFIGFQNTKREVLCCRMICWLVDEDIKVVIKYGYISLGMYV